MREGGTDLQPPLPSAVEDPSLFPGERWGAAAAPGAGTWCSVPAGKLRGVFVVSSPCPLRASLSQNALALRLTHRPGVSYMRLDEVCPGVIEAKFNNLF